MQDFCRSPGGGAEFPEKCYEIEQNLVLDPPLVRFIV